MAKFLDQDFLLRKESGVRELATKDKQDLMPCIALKRKNVLAYSEEFDVFKATPQLFTDLTNHRFTGVFAFIDCSAQETEVAFVRFWMKKLLQ